MFANLPANISTPLESQQESFTPSNNYPPVSSVQMAGIEMNNPHSFLRYSTVSVFKFKSKSISSTNFLHLNQNFIFKSWFNY